VPLRDGGPAINASLYYPAGLAVDRAQLNRYLARRQAGFGSSGRMAIERDSARLTAGVLDGRTTGAPIALTLTNRVFLSPESRVDHA
jgi:chorismate synthase